MNDEVSYRVKSSRVQSEQKVPMVFIEVNYRTGYVFEHLATQVKCDNWRVYVTDTMGVYHCYSTRDHKITIHAGYC